MWYGLTIQSSIFPSIKWANISQCKDIDSLNVCGIATIAEININIHALTQNVIMHRSQPPKYRWATEILMAMAVLACSCSNSNTAEKKKGTNKTKDNIYVSLFDKCELLPIQRLRYSDQYADTCHHFKKYINTQTDIGFSISSIRFYNANKLS